MIEIRFHGRGGQGAVVATNILADAAFREGKDVQAFPYFGVERRGAPVTAFTRIDTKPIRIKSQIYEPDHLVVLDGNLLNMIEKEILSGFKKGGVILINSKKRPSDFKLGVDGKVVTVDANTIAVRYGLGTKLAPVVNTAILGAFIKATGLVKLDILLQCIKESVPLKPEDNAKAAEDAYNEAAVDG